MRRLFVRTKEVGTCRLKFSQLCLSHVVCTWYMSILCFNCQLQRKITTNHIDFARSTTNQRPSLKTKGTLYKNVVWKREGVATSLVEFSLGLPYVCTLSNCLLWVLYGMPFNIKPHTSLILFGLVLEFVYIVVFLTCASKHMKVIHFLQFLLFDAHLVIFNIAFSSSSWQHHNLQHLHCYQPLEAKLLFVLAMHN